MALMKACLFLLPEMDREDYMRQALAQAREAAAEGEVPVGCVIADAAGNIIAQGRNRCEERNDATAHAEQEAIREAARKLNCWNLDGCTLYVTMEPCPMCTGAIMNARIKRVVFGTRDEVKGACGSVINLFSENFPDKAAVFPNVLEKECRDELTNFFREIREKNADR